MADTIISLCYYCNLSVFEGKIRTDLLIGQVGHKTRYSDFKLRGLMWISYMEEIFHNDCNKTLAQAALRGG